MWFVTINYDFDFKSDVRIKFKIIYSLRHYCKISDRTPTRYTFSDMNSKWESILWEKDKVVEVLTSHYCSFLNTKIRQEAWTLEPKI